MQRPSHLHPTFIPGARLSRLPVKNNTSLEDYYHDLFANTGPEHDRERLLQLLDLDVENGAATQGRATPLDHLDRAFRRIDAWTYQGDYLPQADRAELKRRVAHNLLAAQPGLDLTAGTAPTSPDLAILRQVKTENAAWRQGLWDNPVQRNRHPWDEQAPRQEHELADALRRLGHGEPPRLADAVAGPADSRQQEGKQTYWYVTPKPTACDKCLAMAGTLYSKEPERPHPNCKCRHVSCQLTPRQAAALQDDLAVQARAIRDEHERIEQEERAAKIKANCPAYVDDSTWNKDGDPVKISGENSKGKPEQGEFPGYSLPKKTPGGVTITYGKATDDGPTADRRVTKEMRDTVQEVLDDPRCKKAGITSVNISCTTNGRHAEGSAHYDGRAVDISRVNGDHLDRPTDQNTPRRIKVLQEIIEEKQREGKVKENYGPQSQKRLENGHVKDDPKQANGHKNHIHISVPQAIK